MMRSHRGSVLVLSLEGLENPFSPGWVSVVSDWRCGEYVGVATRWLCRRS